MTNKHLEDILTEYPLSLRLVVTRGKEIVQETTVIETLLMLLSMPRDNVLMLLGCTDIILRERMDSSGGDAIVPPQKMWLELDVR